MIFEVEGKGGNYELLGMSKGAGTSRKQPPIVVYRCLDTGQLYHRTQGDFSERLVLQSIARPSTLGQPVKDPQDTLASIPQEATSMTNSPVVRAKLYCHGVTPHEHRPGMKMVQLGAVWSEANTGQPHDENALFGTLTPFANFNSCMTDQAADRFEAGKEYYVDFTLAD